MALHSTLRGCSLPLAIALLGVLPSTARAQNFPSPGNPIITRVQFVFSLVTHYNSVFDRIDFYNDHGSPLGNANYAVPFLVYEPTVTLYNPYNVPMSLIDPIVKISDPPIGFTFKKNGVFLRDDFAAGNFLGLARFQATNESNPAARKTFTLRLSDPPTNPQPGIRVTLQPGESKTFGTWMENNWTWGLEFAGGYSRSFFDSNFYSNFTNVDNRTQNQFGIEAISSSAPYNRAGFQTDGLSLTSGRPPATLYSFETGTLFTSPNWVSIKMTDTVSVQAKTMRTNPNPPETGADFQVDFMRKQTSSPPATLIKSFPMSLTGLIQHPAQPVISRTYQVRDLLQKPTDQTLGGKSPFASLTMIAKSRALREKRFYTTPAVPASDLYEMHFSEVQDFTLGTGILASDAPTGAPQIIAYTRSGDTLYIDFSGRADLYGINNWKVRGSNNLHDGFPDNLDSVTTVTTGQSASGIYKAAINIAGHGDQYFIRIEE
ncbi:hypothetical protein [Luteolibacter soli]|uniref:Uncharacterized protein n=1 Tax=Luteolibacter soli TaxID=3135280 RepID=A0ABU9AVK8_9BACT